VEVGRRAGDGRWKAEVEKGGRQKVEGGRWKAEGGKWKVEDGRWEAEGGRWKAEGGRRKAMCQHLTANDLAYLHHLSKFLSRAKYLTHLIADRMQNLLNNLNTSKKLIISQFLFP
jgi:hypothetical protein